jgi:septal ring-binding cell division protein DamX
MRRIQTISLLSLLSLLIFTTPAIFAANTNNNFNNSAAPETAAPQIGMSYEQLKKAAAKGDPDAEYALGYMYYYGSNGAPRDEPSARMWIQKAAAQGQPQAIKAAQLLSLTEHPKQGGFTTKPPVDRLAEAAKIEPKVPATEEDAVVPAKMTSSSTPVDEERLLKEPSHHYTVQLMGSFNREDVNRFARIHKLGPKAAVYKTHFHGKAWYVLVYGIYSTDQAAEEAIKNLPADIIKLNPWVKSLASVQEGIKQGKMNVANNS